jgi:hypothetical protein
VHAADARQWRSGSDESHVPAFFFDLEIANILWKKVRRRTDPRRSQGGRSKKADRLLEATPARPAASVA